MILLDVAPGDPRGCWCSVISSTMKSQWLEHPTPARRRRRGTDAARASVLAQSRVADSKRVLQAELRPPGLARSLLVLLLPLLAFLPLALAAKRGRRAPGMIIGAVILVAYHQGPWRRALPPTDFDPLAAVAGLYATLAAITFWLFLSSRASAKLRSQASMPVFETLLTAERRSRPRP